MARAVVSFITVSFICLAYYVFVAPQIVAGDKLFDGNTKPEIHEPASGKRNLRSIYGFGPRMLQISRSKIPIELDLLVDNDDGFEKVKRFDDYGHLRFGKRAGEDQFDDYGHMRFGRNSGL